MNDFWRGFWKFFKIESIRLVLLFFAALLAVSGTVVVAIGVEKQVGWNSVFLGAIIFLLVDRAQDKA